MKNQITAAHAAIDSITSTVIVFSDLTQMTTALVSYTQTDKYNVSTSTLNYIPKYTSTSGLTNSLMSEDGTKVSTVSANIQSLTSTVLIFSDNTKMITAAIGTGVLVKSLLLMGG